MKAFSLPEQRMVIRVLAAEVYTVGIVSGHAWWRKEEEPNGTSALRPRVSLLLPSSVACLAVPHQKLDKSPPKNVAPRSPRGPRTTGFAVPTTGPSWHTSQRLIRSRETFLYVATFGNTFKKLPSSFLLVTLV